MSNTIPLAGLNIKQITNVEKIRGFLHVFYPYVMNLIDLHHKDGDEDFKENVTQWITELLGDLDAKLEDVEWYLYGLMETKEIKPFDAIIRNNYENWKNGTSLRELKNTMKGNRKR